MMDISLVCSMGENIPEDMAQLSELILHRFSPLPTFFQQPTATSLLRLL